MGKPNDKTTVRNLRASSYEPGFRDLTLPLNPLKKRVHIRGRAGSVTEISVSGLEILPYEHLIPVTGRILIQCIFVIEGHYRAFNSLFFNNEAWNGLI